MLGASWTSTLWLHAAICAAAEVGRAQACQAALVLTGALCPLRPGVVRKRDDGTEEILLEDLLGWSKAPSA